ncbi:MAG: NrsF family protein [Spirochaetia bacterium]|nr:NrsF family protein [Spirochaetia bacterium]
MKTEKLIDLLARDGKPVKPMQHPPVRFAIWLLLTSALILFTYPAVSYFFGHPFQLNRDLTGFFLLFATTLILGFLAFVLNSPVLMNPILKYLISAVFFIWIARTIVMVFFLEESVFEHLMHMYSGHPHTGCMANTYIYFIIPFFIIILMLRTGYTLDKHLAGFYAVTASLSIAELMTSAMCPHAEPLHTLVWHIVPIIPLPIAVWILSEKIFTNAK